MDYAFDSCCGAMAWPRASSWVKVGFLFFRFFFFFLLAHSETVVVVVLVCSVVRLGLGLYWVAWQVVRHTNPTGDYSGMTTFPNAMFFYPSIR
jgi:hypothetical protein